MNRDTELYDTTIGLEVEFLRDDKFTLSEVKKELQKVTGMKIRVEDKHHSDFTPTKEEAKIEPDFSGGKNLVELVTAPLDYKEARIVLMNVLNWMKKNPNVSTNDRCGLHVNVNYPNQPYIANMDILKFILTFNENEVYKRFPNRKGNIYTKSIKSIAPVHSNFDFNTIGMSKTNFTYPNTKYYGVNFEKLAKNYLEFRYIGGENYESKLTEIMELVDYFLISLKKAYNAKYDENMRKRLIKIVEKKKQLFMAGKSYFHFQNIFRNIDILIDTKSNDEVIKAHFPRLWERMFPFFMSFMNLNYKMKGIINYDTDLSIIEYKDFNFKNGEIMPHGTLFYDCNIKQCVVNNQQLYYCRMIESDLNTCVTNYCEMETTRLKSGEHTNDKLMDCYISGQIHVEGSEIVEGIFREGTYSNCDIKDSVEMIDAEEKNEE